MLDKHSIQFLTLPVPFFVMFDFPRRRPYIWQPWILAATWSLADIFLFEMWACRFFRKPNTCGTRNFLNLFAFAFGPPVLALLALGQRRIWASIGAIQWLILCGVLLIGQGGAPKLFYRNVVNCESD
jgi:osomolarity two-component system sensor histidine kinase SLN1